jgi:glycosyltransferase involved in cell wall biosynthesis
MIERQRRNIAGAPHGTECMAAAGNLQLEPPRLAPPPQRPQRATLPRVLYALALTPGHKFGSIEEQIVTLAERFRAEGSLFLPLFLCGPGGSVDFYRTQGIEAESLEWRPRRLGNLRRLLGILRRYQVDVVHWNFTSPLGNPYLGWLSLLRPGLRHFLTDHISRPWPIPAPARGPKRWLKQLLTRRYERVFCISRFVLNCLRAQEAWPSDRLTACRYFVNTDRFRPDPGVRDSLRRKLGARDRFVAVTAAHLIPAKGIDVLIRAFGEMPSDAVLWVVGDGPHRPALEALSAERGVASRVRMLGHQFDVCPYMQAADCFVCPSLWGEAVGLVNIEAAACALPVIASRIGGIPEYVDDGETGLLFEPGDAHALAHALCALMLDHSLRHRLGEQARAMAVQRFATEVRVPEVVELYRS